MLGTIIIYNLSIMLENVTCILPELSFLCENACHTSYARTMVSVNSLPQSSEEKAISPSPLHPTPRSSKFRLFLVSS